MGLRVYDNKPTLLDYSSVEQGLKAREPFARSREHAFQKYVLESVFSVLPEDVDQHIVDGGNDRGIDIVYVDHTNKTVNFCSTKTVDGFARSLKNFPGKEVDKIISFIDDLLHVRDRLLES